MYICSQSGELVHPIHLRHLVEEASAAEGGVPVDDPEEKGLERGGPVHGGD